MRRAMTTGLGAATLMALAGLAQAAIVIDGDIADWADVPTLATSIDNGITGKPDFAELKVTEDANNVYVLYTLHRAENPQALGVFLGIDGDNDTSTGFNVHDLGVVGAEAAWQNDFPFEQTNGVFNTNAGLVNAAISISPYATTTTAVEMSVSKLAARGSGGNVFPDAGETMRIIVYTDGDNLDFIYGDYTMVPEPASLALLASTGLLLSLRRRRR